jgi:hypothetical protein
MKALSVRAPWWWAILHLGKDIENREWRTAFRGRILLHASRWYVERDVLEDVNCIDGIVRAGMDDLLADGNPREVFSRSSGCIVGSVEIVGCVTHSDSPWFFGTYGFQLANPIALPAPIPFKGALGFFDVPDNFLVSRPHDNGHPEE